MQTSCEICQEQAVSRFCPSCEDAIEKIIQKMTGGKLFKKELVSMVRLLACKQTGE